jgi:hypothetical protein
MSDFLKLKALNFIEYLDDENPDWIKSNSSIADAFVEFHQVSNVKEFKGRSIPTDTDDIVYELRKIIEVYYSNSPDYYKELSMFTDEELLNTNNAINQLRADLSVLLFQMSEVTFKEISKEMSSIESRKDKADAEAYLRAYNEAKKITHIETDAKGNEKVVKMSLSMLNEWSRKMLKMDPIYLQEIEECDRIDKQYWRLNNMFKQAKNILDAMSKEIRK